MDEIQPDPLLEAAKCFLSRRNYASCRNYAVRAQQSDLQNSDATNQILAVADTLAAAENRISETLTDWYAILQVYRYSQDTHFINKQFKNLSLLLFPEINKFPFADEAFKLICEAGSVLTNPSKKSQFDSELQRFELRLNETFWTTCPYCYYMFEYARVYEDCCLRCQNVKCGKGFHAVAIEAPPLEMVEKGQYMCMGFFPLGFDGSVKKGVSSWSPFSPMVRVNKEAEKKNDGVGNECNSESFVEISDESNDSNYGFVRRNAEMYMDENGNVVRPEELQQNNDSVAGKPVMKRRKKSVPKNAKKLMGKGIRIGKMDTVAQDPEGLDLNTEAGYDADDGNGNNNGNEVGGVGGTEMRSGADFDTSGVDLFAGDDDIFVSFPDF